MATSLLFNSGIQSAGEAFSSAGSIAFSTSVVRSGSASLHLTAGGTLTFKKRPAGGTLINFAQSYRFYIRIDTLPGVNTTIVSSTGLGCPQLTLNTTGTVTLDGSVTSANAFTADATFHRVDVNSSGTTRTVYVDGIQWAQETGASSATPASDITYGASGSGFDLYLADLAVDDSSIGAPAAGANNKVLLLIPTAGNNAGSWTDGAGGTGDIHGSVDNIPPVGIAAATAAAKIKNAVSGTALDYIATMQTYTAAGIPAGSTINAIMAICNDGEEVATGTKSGGIWCASNPAQSAVVVGAGVGFDYGDDTATIVATFPTGWVTHVGIVAVAPSVTLSSAPTVTVRKGSSTTRVVDVDFMGLYVDYTPPPIGKNINAQQSVKRANFF